MARTTPKDVRLTPLQIDVLELLRNSKGELVHWDALARRFTDASGETDHRLSEAVWGLIDAGILFEPKEFARHYHITEQALRVADDIIANRPLAVKEEARAEARHRSRNINERADEPTLPPLAPDPPSESGSGSRGSDAGTPADQKRRRKGGADAGSRPRR